MKITKITNDGDIYTVTFTPNLIQKAFGIKEKTEKFKDMGRVYQFSNGHVYVDQRGKELGNIIGERTYIRKAIDEWRNRF